MRQDQHLDARGVVFVDCREKPFAVAHGNPEFVFGVACADVVFASRIRRWLLSWRNSKGNCEEAKRWKVEAAEFEHRQRESPEGPE